MSTAVAAIKRRGPLPTWVTAALLSSLSVLIGLLSGMFGSAGEAGALFALAAIALIVVLWKRPELSPIVVLVAALTVEQFPFTSGQPGSTSTAPTPSDYTDRLPLFHGLGGGLHVSPADMLLLALLTIWMFKRETAATRTVPRSALTYAVGAVVLAALIGLAVGQAHGGQLRTALTEVRPYMYDGNYVVASAHARPWRKQLNLLAAYCYFYNPVWLVSNLLRRKTKVGMKPAYMQLVGMVGLTQSIRRTFGWALRLMFGKIERLVVPPQTSVPIRSITGDVAAHAPVEISIHAKRTHAGALTMLSAS
jgi:hypothetical protein